MLAMELWRFLAKLASVEHRIYKSIHVYTRQHMERQATVCVRLAEC